MKKDIRVHLVMEQSEIDAIDAWRRAQPKLVSQSEAIRRLIKCGLAAKDVER